MVKIIVRNLIINMPFVHCVTYVTLMTCVVRWNIPTFARITHVAHMYVQTKLQEPVLKYNCVSKVL